MKRVVSMEKMEQIQILPRNAMEEIMQNIGLIVTMPLESGPMCRDVGLNTKSFGMPEQQGRAIMTRDVFVAVQDQEPRAALQTVDFEGSATGGTTTAIMEVKIEDG
ncbi:MAG: hypothetical protein IJ206_09115 [Oscillospiraceae bacterium]|nr:hypothetical protein [Oscillospiraceae bacterium]